MGDWSDKLDYEQREYYGHFYDPDREEETEEMTTVEILKEMAFTATETQRRALEDAISALSENKSEWIPVSERLPEDVKFVLFCDINEDIMLGYHLDGRPKTHFTQDGSFEDMKNVRAWQPLPEPYKAEKGGE